MLTANVPIGKVIGSRAETEPSTSKPSDRAAATEQPDCDDRRDAHASLALLAKPVASTTAAKPARTLAVM